MHPAFRGALLVLSLFATANVGAAAADEPPRTVPMPRLGDQVAYSGVNLTTGAPAPSFSFAWDDHATLPDRWGRAMEVDRVVLASTGGVPRRYGFEAGSLQAITMEYVGGTTATGGDGGSSPFGSGASEIREYLALDYGTIWWPLLQHDVCALRGGWQGRALEDIPHLSPSAFCPHVEWATTLESIGTEDVDGRDALRIQLSGAQKMVTFWISTDSPYPLAIMWCGNILGATCRPEPNPSGVVLSAYEEGIGARVALVPATKHDFHPPFAKAPFTRDGPRDDRNVSFTLEKALEAMAEDASIPDFHHWREQHPDAILVAAFHRFDPRPDALAPERETWALFWKTPSGETRVLSIQRDGSCVGIPNLFVPAGVTQLGDVCEPRIAEIKGSTGNDPLAAPPTMLTLKAAETAFLAAASPGVEVSFITFDVGTASHPATIEVWGDAPRDPAVRPPPQGADGETPSEGVTLDARTGEARVRYTTANVTLLPGRAGLFSLKAPPLKNAEAPGFSFGFSGIAGPIPTAAGTTLAAGAFLFLVAARVLSLVVCLYTRLTRKDVLAHPRRAAVLATLERWPGASTSDLMRHLGVGESTIRHHLAILARAKAIRSIRSGKRMHHFLPDRTGHQASMRTALLHAGGAQAQVFACIERRPGILSAELARELGVSRAAIHYTVRRLVSAGLVQPRAESSKKRLYPLEGQDERGLG